MGTHYTTNARGRDTDAVLHDEYAAFVERLDTALNIKAGLAEILRRGDPADTDDPAITDGP